MKKIQDFGQKIGGARKDMYSTGMTWTDFGDFNEREIKAYATKDCIFPKINYQDLIRKGENRMVVYWKKLVRDFSPTKPDSNDNIDIKWFVDLLSFLKNLVNDVITKEDILYKVPSIFDENQDIFSRVSAFNSRADMKKFREFKVLLNMDEYEYNRLDRKRKTLKSFASEEEYIDATYLPEIIEFNPNNVATFIREGKTIYKFNGKRVIVRKSNEMFNPIEGTYCLISYKDGFVEGNIKSYEQAQEVLSEYIQKGIEKEYGLKDKKVNQRKQLLPPQFENLVRIGDDVIGIRTITGQTFLDEFGFRGGEFGNWCTQKERQESLNHAYEAFKDLAKALNIDDKDIALLGELAIAFGARGQGKALAHYEPLRRVINLTKMKGAGSLAHEWGHAFDYIIGETYEDTKQEMSSARTMMGRSLMQAIRLDTRGYRSKFYADALKLDHLYSSGKTYYSKPTELVARAFACYVYDKLAELGCRNDYLCGHAFAMCGNDGVNPIPTFVTDEDKNRVYAQFDLIIDTLKQEGVFHERVEVVTEEIKEEPEVYFNSFEQMDIFQFA